MIDYELCNGERGSNDHVFHNCFARVYGVDVRASAFAKRRVAGARWLLKFALVSHRRLVTSPSEMNLQFRP
jgi:hypothetical protein